ncbi:uncharacterized protein SCHCODRAFT_02538290 [Schizophyllum commune H4-8]|uniref:Uncharacterized protein n=1 Tax=Schizophyllum commune (strain H4-8 / FGSC 9210) TaxID=578458 RepID=D8PP32_SCHCM|nr:uncharacterized protein SCHCODRAFT_02538290 [Schizophyllum commune H4-8]KAI5893363.1 hypothetical protein SCHCODRAFT_02538290 [Schizophyllum commune H4-8]
MSFDGFQNIYAQPQQPSTMPPSQFSPQIPQQQQQPQGNWQSQASNDAFYASQRPDTQHQQAYYPRQGQLSAYDASSQPQSVEQRMYAASQMQAQANAQYYRQSMSNGAQQQHQVPQHQPIQARPPPPRNELESALGISPSTPQSPFSAPVQTQPPLHPAKMFPPVPPAHTDNVLAMQIRHLFEQLSVMKRDADNERECTRVREEGLQDDIKALRTELNEKAERFECSERELNEQITSLRNQLATLTQSPPRGPWAQPHFSASRPSVQPGMPPPSPVSLPSVESPYADSPAMRHQHLVPPPNAGFPPSGPFQHQQMMRMRAHESSPRFAMSHPPVPMPQQPPQHLQQQGQAHGQPQLALSPPSSAMAMGQLPMPSISQFHSTSAPSHAPPPPAPAQAPDSHKPQSTLGKRKSENEDDLQDKHKKPAPSPSSTITTTQEALIAHSLHCMGVAEDAPLPDEPFEPGLPWPASEPVRFAWSTTLRRSKHNQNMVKRIAADIVQNKDRYPGVPAGELDTEESLTGAMASVYETLRERYKQQQGRGRKRPASQGKAKAKR